MPRDYATAMSALLRAASIEDHDEILQAANATLKTDNTDEVAWHTIVVALLKLDRFDDAFRAISEGGIKLETTCALEKAYALYKLGKLHEAITTLNSSGLKNRALSHMAAQIAYRAEQFDEAHAIYNRLLGATYHEENHDIKINLSAAQAQAKWKRTTTLHETESQIELESFELCYNAACANIAQGSLSSASRHLNRALNLCEASDELNSEEKEEERRAILSQQAFVLAKLGKVDHARNMHRLTNFRINSDQNLRIIGQNNHLALGNMPQNPFLLELQTGTWLSSRTETQTFNFQSHLLARNSSIISLLAHKTDSVRTKAYRAVKHSQSRSLSIKQNDMSVIGAAADTQGLSEKEVLRSLISLSKRRPHDAGLVVIIVQLHLQMRNLGAAVYTLDSFLSPLENSNSEQGLMLRFMPGLVALSVFLKKIQKREGCVKAELIKAGRYWQNRPGPSAPSLLKETGIELISSSTNDDVMLAGAFFKKIMIEENLASPTTSVGLVAALAAADAPEVESNTPLLPSTNSLVQEIEVDKLLNSGILVLPTCSASKTRLDFQDNKAERAVKKRKRRLPKSFMDGQAPDPERWLPLRDRVSYRPKGRKGRKKAAEFTQGGLVKATETMGLVGGGGVKIEKAAAINASKKKKRSKK
ncbi:hypothetical protein E4U47_007505 [Claviceps purpurea]|nr:hypothetical protein E4U47_007505 [Claviceps purpurea]